MKNNLLYVGVAALLLVMLLLLNDPLMVWMPPMAATGALVAAAVLVGAWAGFLMLERGGDEREREHRMRADRVAYMCGIAVLTLGILIEGFRTHHIDSFIAFSLGAMVVAKLIARIYAQWYK